jgi:hypothetical protein
LVWLRSPEGGRFLWLLAGASSLREENGKGVRELTSRIAGDVTDPEHDKPYAFKLPLVGVRFDSCEGQVSHFWGWINPDWGKSLFDKVRFPFPGYNPTKHPDATVCHKCPEDHVIIPEGYFAGPPETEETRKLVSFVRGLAVDIYMGPTMYMGGFDTD